MQNKESFGEQIRKLREARKMPIRKVAAHLDIDPSTLSKIERNERSANRYYVEKLSELFDIEFNQLLVEFLSDKVTYQLIDEECSQEVLEAAEKKIEYERARRLTQSEIQFEDRNNDDR